MNSILEKFQKILFLIYPAVLILNPKLANNFMVFVLLVLVLGNIYINRKIIFTFYEKFMLVFVIAVLISIIFKNTTTNSGLVMIERHFRWLILPTLLGQLEIKKEDIKCMFLSAFFGILGYTYRFISEMINLKNAELSWLEFFKSSLLWNHRYLSEYSIPQSALILGVTFIILYYVICINDEKKYKLFLLLGLFLSGIVLMSVQSRGMTLTLFILILLLGIIRKEKIIKIVSGLIIISSIIGGIYFSNSHYIQRYENLGKDSSSLARVEVYKEAFRLFEKNKINGVGLEGFFESQETENYKYLEKYGHPHNMALKLLAETGAIGFISYYLFVGSILINLWKKYKENKYFLIGILALLTLVLYENIETMFIKAIALPYIFFIIGISLNQIYRDKYLEKIKEK